MILSRRSFIAGASALIAAPAIVKIENIMPVRNRIIPASAEVLDHLSTGMCEPWVMLAYDYTNDVGYWVNLNDGRRWRTTTFEIVYPGDIRYELRKATQDA